MILVLEIAMLVVGLIALCSGKLKLSAERVVEGPAVRVAGAVLILPLLLVAYLLTERVRVRTPLCKKHQNYWRGRRLLSWAVFSALLIFFLCLITFAATIEESASRFPSPSLLFWLAGMVITFAMEFVHAGAIRATEITDDAVALTNVADAFVAQWQRERKGLAAH